MQRRDLALARPIDLDPPGAPGAQAAARRGPRLDGSARHPRRRRGEAPHGGQLGRCGTANGRESRPDVRSVRWRLRRRIADERSGGRAGDDGALGATADVPRRGSGERSHHRDAIRLPARLPARARRRRRPRAEHGGSGGSEAARHFGTEVVARYLGLRYNHPSGEDSLELYPSDQITRAEAAHSLAVVLEAGEWSLESARETLSGFSLPHYAATQLQVLQIAVSKIGMPYVWAARPTAPKTASRTAAMTAGASRGASTRSPACPSGAKILGRTAAEQAGEIPKSRARPAPERAGRRPAVLRHAPTSTRRRPRPTSPRGDRAQQRMGDPLLEPGRLRAAAELRVAREELHLGAPGALRGRSAATPAAQICSRRADLPPRSRRATDQGGMDARGGRRALRGLEDDL